MFTLWTLFIHRRPFARHLFPGANLRPIRVPRLHAVMEPEIRRSGDEFAFTVSERCASINRHIARFVPSVTKHKAKKKAAGGWRLYAYAYPASTPCVRNRRVDAMKETKPRRVASRVGKTTTRIVVVVVVGNHSFVSFNDAPSSSEHSLPHPPHETVVDCVWSVNRDPHRAQNPFPFPMPVGINRSIEWIPVGVARSEASLSLQCEARARPSNRTRLFNAAAAAPPARVVDPDTPTSRVPVDPVVVVDDAVE